MPYLRYLLLSSRTDILRLVPHAVFLLKMYKITHGVQDLSHSPLQSEDYMDFNLEFQKARWHPWWALTQRDPKG